MDMKYRNLGMLTKNSQNYYSDSDTHALTNSSSCRISSSLVYTLPSQRTTTEQPKLDVNHGSFGFGSRLAQQTVVRLQTGQKIIN